jgi:Fic family protein
MKLTEIGKIIKQPQGFKAFIPNPFPPKEEFDFDPKLIKLNEKASMAIARLDGVTKRLPDSNFFLLMYLRKDATASSQIEGTQATMIDAIEAEIQVNTNTPQDVDDIIHYIKALNYGMKRVTQDKFPISLRFIKELHNILMANARTTHFADPGEFRKTQNWIGGTRPDNAKFVPPPVEDMKKSLDELEKFIHEEEFPYTIIKAALIHAQFETIHPFLDGNGRTGRMLITFYLWQMKILETPVLFLSHYFKKHQKLYYEKLACYHQGKVREWLEFFLDGVIEIAEEAIEIVDKVSALRDRDMLKIQQFSKKASESALVVFSKLFEQPIVNVATVREWTGFSSRSAATTVVMRFVDIGILVPKYADKKYGQSYIYKEYTDIFSE